MKYNSLFEYVVSLKMQEHIKSGECNIFNAKGKVLICPLLKKSLLPTIDHNIKPTFGVTLPTIYNLIECLYSPEQRFVNQELADAGYQNMVIEELHSVPIVVIQGTIDVGIDPLFWINMDELGNPKRQSIIMNIGV